MVTDIAVDRIGEVHHCRSAGQGHDLALGGEHIDRIREQVDLDVVPELGGVARLVLDVQQRLQPLGAQAVTGGVFRVVDLVQPVRSDARFGHDVHGLRTHLEFDVHAGRADQGGMQRLVAIELGDRDMVFELARHGLVELVQQPQRGIAIYNSRH